MHTLLSHLAQFSAFARQGELLCTQALAHLLQAPAAGVAFAELLTRAIGVAVAPARTWHAESIQKDGGRPDLEGRDSDGKPVVKVEGKLGAELSKEQLESYRVDLLRSANLAVLVVLVPRHRRVEVKDQLADWYAANGEGPWMLPGDRPVHLVLLHWDEVIATLEHVAHVYPASDVAQFASLYRALNGYDILPLADTADILAWREREPAFVALVDRVTRQLSRPDKVMPMGVELLGQAPVGAQDAGYRRRYMSRPLNGKRPCFSIGVRDPFAGFETPIWLRVDPQTGRQFPLLRQRLREADKAGRVRLVESGEALWVPLFVPLNADGEQMVAALVEQSEAFIQVAYAPAG